MKKVYTLISITLLSIGAAIAQPTPQFPNAGFENWANFNSVMEPVSYHSNKTGTGWATSGPQTCFQETASPHSGTYCVRVETGSALGVAVNGALTSGIVNAPSATNKLEGYIGTKQSSTGTDIRRIAFDGRPDSLIGFYKYTQSTSTGGTGGATGFASGSTTYGAGGGGGGGSTGSAATCGGNGSPGYCLIQWIA